MPRTRSLAWSELKIGILAAIALVLAVTMIFLVGGQGGFFWQRYHLKTKFANVQGLKGGGLVRVAGVEVGTVKGIEFKGAEVEVSMEVLKSMHDRITTDSRAMLGSLSLLGEAVVDISAATSGQPLEDGGFVPSAKTPGSIADVNDRAACDTALATNSPTMASASSASEGRPQSLSVFLVNFLAVRPDWAPVASAHAATAGESHQSEGIRTTRGRPGAQFVSEILLLPAWGRVFRPAPRTEADLTRTIYQDLHMLVLLVNQPVVSLADQLVQADAVGDQQVAAKARVAHDSDGLVVQAIAAHAA